MASLRIFSVLYFVGIIALIGVSIYLLILFIKLARRGIKALDIYISEKNKDINN